MKKMTLRALFLSYVKTLPIMLAAFFTSILGLILDLDWLIYTGVALWGVCLFCVIILFMHSCSVLYNKKKNKKRLFKELGEYDYFEIYEDVHGEDLLSFSDGMLLEIVSRQNLNIIEGVKDKEYETLCEPRLLVYVLSTFDNEILNGGLFQFFANCTGDMVSLTSKFLYDVGAYEYKDLFDGFLKDNSISLSEISLLKAKTIEDYLNKEKMLDYGSFNKKYYELQPSLRKLISDYIRDKISEF